MPAPNVEDSYEFHVAKRMADAIYEEKMSQTKEEIIETLLAILYDEQQTC